MFSCFRSALGISFVCCNSGYWTSVGVSLSLCGGGGENTTHESTNDQLAFRNCSVWLRFLCVHHVLSVVRAWSCVVKVTQRPSMPQEQQRVPHTTDTSGEDTDVETLRRRVRSWRTIKMKKEYAVGELAQFLVTGLAHAANKLGEFYWRVVRKDVLILTHGKNETLRHFQGHHHLANDQRLRLETPSWQDVRFWRQSAPRRRAWETRPRVSIPRRPDSECFQNVELHLPMLAKVSCLIDALQLRGATSLSQNFGGDSCCPTAESM